MKKIETVIFPVIILIITVLLLFSCNNTDFKKPVCKNGIIDISYWDFKKDGIIMLNGEWKILWNNNIKDICNLNFEGLDTMKVPGTWNNKYKTGLGYAWLILKVKLKVKDKLFIFLPYSFTSYELFINGISVIKNGYPGNNKNDTIPQFMPIYGNIPKLGDNLLIFWKISNFYDFQGGPVRSPAIGTANDIKKNYNRTIIFTAISIGITLMMGLYTFILWLYQRTEKVYFFFSLLCFSIIIKTLFSDDIFQLLCNISNVIIFQIHYKIQYIFGLFTAYIVWILIVIMYPGNANKKILKGLNIGLLLYLVYAVSVDSVYLSSTIFYQIILVLFIDILFIFILFKAVLKRKEFSLIIFISVLIYYLCTIQDVLYNFRILNTGNIMQYGLLLLLISYSITLSIKFSNAFKTAEHLSQNLKQEVAIQTQELRKAKEKIEQHSQEKTQFFINVVHETKTPLTLIQTGFNEYVKSLKKRATPELVDMKFFINKLCRDITNLLDAINIEKGRILYNHNTITNISSILVFSIKFFMIIARKKNIKLISSCEESVFCKIDPSAIERIINNLLDNAFKYIGSGNTISANLKIRNSSIYLTIEDNGIGISEEQQKNIFLPYYQISKEKRNIQGLGLGLSIVKHIVDSVSGDIKIESELNKGTKVAIVLPKHIINETDVITDYIPAEPMATANFEKPVEEPHDENKYTVFFIEDKIELITAMQKSMCKYFNFYYALDGQEALDKLDFIPRPDIFISDIMMDKMDGYEFYAQLQESGEYKNTPFIFLTARTVQKEKEESLEKGILDYIYKPFKMDELIKKILALLKYRQNVIESERKIIDEKIASLIWSNKDIKSLKFESKCREHELTSREKDVTELIVKGLSQKQIAIKLHLSPGTIVRHVYKIYKKCKVHTNMELLKLFLE